MRSFRYSFTDWKPLRNGWKSKNDVTLYDDHVNWIFSCGSKMTECTHSFLFCGGGDRVLDTYGCCSIAHAKRTLHIWYPNKTNGYHDVWYTQNKQVIVYINI